MTIRDLKRVYYIDKEIKSLSKTLEEINSSSYVKAKSYPDTVTVSNYNRYSKVESRAVAIEKIKTTIEDKIVELQETYDTILQWIYSIDDSLVRLILKLRYLDLYTWNQVANAVGGGNSEYSVKKMASRYLQQHIEN